MAVYKQAKSKYWWYKFTWNGELIRESTKQTNKRVAEQMEAAHRTALAKGEVGIREKVPVPTLKQFAETDFLPYVRATFAPKPKTKEYYENGVKSLLADSKLSSEALDKITSEKIASFVAARQEAGLQVSSINRELEVLRRIFRLALEWGRVDKVLPQVRMLSGERHRDRVLSFEEENRYLNEAPPLLRSVATILLDCGMRPEECFRLKWENIRDGRIEIEHGKTANARRSIPMSDRVAAIVDMRQTDATSPWVFPALTKSGHIEKSSLKKQHQRACEGKTNAEKNRGRKPGEPKKWNVEPFPLYTLRHTCLTRWAPYMDPWALAYLAGHRDMSITKRYVHPQQRTLKEAIEKARAVQGGHTSGHTAQSDSNATSREMTPIN